MQTAATTSMPSTDVALAAGDGGVVCPRCRLADSPLLRLRGLLGRAGLSSDEGLLIRPAWAIHTCFMRFPIDALFLGRDLEILAVRPNLRPWRAATRRGARAVLELRAGEAARRGLAVGDRLTMERA